MELMYNKAILYNYYIIYKHKNIIYIYSILLIILKYAFFIFIFWRIL